MHVVPLKQSELYFVFSLMFNCVNGSFPTHYQWLPREGRSPGNEFLEGQRCGLVTQGAHSSGVSYCLFEK